MRKKIMALLCAICLVAGMSTGCAIEDMIKSNLGITEPQVAAEFNVICTHFAQYDWIKQVLGDKAPKFNVTLLAQEGTNYHDYAADEKQYTDISVCNMFVYNGGNSDDWANEALDVSSNKGRQVVNIMQSMKMKGKEDEHVWLSLKKVPVAIDAIAGALGKVDPADADAFKANAASYKEKIKALDDKLAGAAGSKKKEFIMFADRYPFTYLFKDYGIKVVSMNDDCTGSEEKEDIANFTLFAEQCEDAGINKVFVCEGSDQENAKGIINSLSGNGAEVCEINSMELLTAKDYDGGKTYLSLMTDTVEKISAALA